MTSQSTTTRHMDAATDDRRHRLDIDISRSFHARHQRIERIETLEMVGSVASLSGLTLCVDDFSAPMGGQCEIITRTGQHIPGEVIGFRDRQAIVMPLGEMGGISRGDAVRSLDTEATVWVGRHLLGRVLNGCGEPVDGKGPALCQSRREVFSDRVPPLSRTRIAEPIGTGIRALDTLTTVGCGQRMGLFSGPGVGKSILLGMIARHTEADVTVIALIGERGREVREFIEMVLGEEGLQRAVVVASTSDDPAPLRVRAGFVAASIAEYFRDQGKNVLLLMDSVTRIAMAQRQIGLAIGEPPATRGYTPSVFALLPLLVERCTRNEFGSITGFFTILVEGDDFSEPIADAMRGLLDGHLWLSRDLAKRGHYPAIDFLDSLSRLMPQLTSPEHLGAAREIVRHLAVYRDHEDLITVGAYALGSQPEVDQAIKAYPLIKAFLEQSMNEAISRTQSTRQLAELIQRIRQVARGQGGHASARPQAAQANSSGSARPGIAGLR